MNSDLLYIIISAISGFIFGAFVFYLILFKIKNNSKDIVLKAEKAAERIEKQAYLNGKERLQNERNNFKKQLKDREFSLQNQQKQFRNREKEIRRKENHLAEEKQSLKNQQDELFNLRKKLIEMADNYEEIVEKEQKRLENVAGLSKEDAKTDLINTLIKDAKAEAAQSLIEIKNETEERAKIDAREIMAFAIERMSTEYTMENTLSSVSLPNDNWKGVIIGKEGRNIRAFENSTDVKVIVDDTPETVVLSSFDPVKREIARIAMSKLVKEKNINPKTIEQLINKAQEVVEKEMKASANATIERLNLKDVHPELMQMLGRLMYRTSYGQNILQHSTEVSLLAGAMAAELNLDVQLAKRAGLFHDIGKAISNDSNASHVELGVEITTRCNEHPVVINSVLAHHEEAEPIAPESVLVTAADKISGARPGARRESLEAYTQRIEKLEELANSFDGVAKTFALSAGREIRVIVEPDNVTDARADLLAQDIAEKIESTLEYPGQIKVTVLRRLVTTQYTDFQRKGYMNDNAPGAN
ncbi:MAG: ribonuclease Y [Calditrichia bacterium]|nr:ribonuclease Y [Calditrichia bacterium]